MIRAQLSLSGTTGPLAYLLLAPLIILTQHAYVAAALLRSGQFTVSDPWFWFFPVWHLSEHASAIPTGVVMGSFAVCLVVACLLTILSFRRANWSERGHGLALFAMLPTVQMVAALLLAAIPPRVPTADQDQFDRPDPTGGQLRHVATGLFAGMTVIVSAVVLAGPVIGAYGWGLFVMTPLLAGFLTGWFANRRQRLSVAETLGLVMAAGALGCLALLALALEGLVCIIVILPLAAVVAAVGGLLGRALALLTHDRTTPFVSVAALPLILMLEAALPPQLAIAAAEQVDIAAPPAAVWAALISDRPISAPPGLVGRAGFAYALGGHLSGRHQGARRTGYFSTGKASERANIWVPERELGLSVLSQPPAMEEMSPYRRVHAPHVQGYFITEWTRFRLTPLSDGGTRLTISAAHQLRIDPIPYWAPIARWAIAQNMRRVLGDIRDAAEQSVTTPRLPG